MKLTDTQRRALAMLRLLHIHQQQDLLAEMERQVVANRIANRLTMSAGKLRKLKIPADTKVARAFGAAPHTSTKGKPAR